MNIGTKDLRIALLNAQKEIERIRLDFDNGVDLEVIEGAVYMYTQKLVATFNLFGVQERFYQRNPR